MRLLYTPAYCERGLDESAQGKLAAYGDLILGSGFNITGIAQPEDIERLHFLDSLSLLDIEEVAAARTVVDLGSGGGLPALVLAVALPDVKVRVIESQRKKCIFIEKAATVRTSGVRRHLRSSPMTFSLLRAFAPALKCQNM